MNYEVYRKDNHTGDKHIIAQFSSYADLDICLNGLINIYGDNLYVYAITDYGRGILGKLSHSAKYVRAHAAERDLPSGLLEA